MSSIGLSFREGLADDRPRSLTSAVQERLRADILSTRLLPGQKLHIAGLAKQFSVSLAAVREALSRLVAGGSAGRHPDPGRYRGVGAAAIDRARRPELVDVGRAVFHGAISGPLHLSG